MSNPINRRKFLQAAAPLIAAPALLSNRNLLAAPKEKSKLLSSPQLTVLHDGIGNPPNYLWSTRPGYASFISTALGTGYAILTIYKGIVSSPKMLKSIEIVGARYNYVGDFSVFGSAAFPIYMGIWNESVGTFCASPLSGSLSSMTLPVPNIGSATVPYHTFGNTGSGFLLGWDNLNIALPANTTIKIAVYFEVGGLNNGTYIYASPISPFVPNWVFDDESECFTIGEPSMSSRITVSDIITAANADISGRVVNQSGGGISRARLTLLNTQTGASFSAITNSFGYFRFTNQPTGVTYILSAQAKGQTFNPNSQTLQLLDNVTNLEFVGGSI